jgi:hypothetical protein
VRAALGNDDFDAAWAEGAARNLDDTLNRALSAAAGATGGAVAE